MDVQSLAQHILALEPAKDTARLAFYNFLRNICEPSQPLTSALINSYYSRALSFSHWQEHKAHLFQEAQSAVLNFARANPTISDQVFTELQGSWQLDDIETIRISNQKNMSALIAKSLEKEMGPQERSRILFDKNGNAICIVLNGSRQSQAQLRIFSFPPVAKLIKGELSPVSMDMVVSYGGDLQLATNVVQEIDVGAHTVARFYTQGDGCHGALLRGYTFQKYAVMEGGALSRYPIVFYPIKRMEQFFIDRKTDPMYMELTQILEKATDLLGQEPHEGSYPEAVKFAKQALERGQLALEQIFPDDKLVHLLITNLEKTLRLTPAAAAITSKPASVSEPVKSSPAYPTGAWAGEQLPPHYVEINTGSEAGEEQWQTKTNRPLDL